jgi:hypothetical protein
LGAAAAASAAAPSSAAASAATGASVAEMASAAGEEAAGEEAAGEEAAIEEAAGEEAAGEEAAGEEAASAPVPCVTRLVRNYRSHASLLALPSKMFYGEALRECGRPEETRAMEQWSGLRRHGFPLLWWGINSAHMHEVDSPSFFNPLEAEKAPPPPRAAAPPRAPSHARAAATPCGSKLVTRS